MRLSHEQMLEVAQYAFTRMDGAWFLALAKAWKQLAYVFGKNIRKKYFPDPVWPESFLEALDIFSRVLKIEGREISVQGEQIIIRITDCETQRAIAKAGVADCGIVTVQTYKGIINGLFDRTVEAHVAHTKNLNHGDECCEVVISRL